MGQVFALRFFKTENTLQRDEELSEEEKAALREARLRREEEEKATRFVSTFRLLSGTIIDGDFRGLKDTADARARVADALGWPMGSVQLLTLSGGAIIFDKDPLPKEGEDEVLALVDSEAVRAFVDGFTDELPKIDPPSLLMFAVMRANIHAVRMFLLNGQDPCEVDEQRGGQTPLHVAAQSQSFRGAEMCRLLLGAKADVSVSNNEGLTPLHIAAERNSPEVARALLNAGADRNVLAIPKYNRGQAGQTPTQLALASRNIDLVEVFSDHVVRMEKAAFILPTQS